MTSWYRNESLLCRIYLLCSLPSVLRLDPLLCNTLLEYQSWTKEWISWRPHKCHPSVKWAAGVNTRPSGSVPQPSPCYTQDPGIIKHFSVYHLSDLVCSLGESLENAQWASQQLQISLLWTLSTVRRRYGRKLEERHYQDFPTNSHQSVINIRTNLVPPCGQSLTDSFPVMWLLFQGGFPGWMILLLTILALPLTTTMLLTTIRQCVVQTCSRNPRMTSTVFFSALAILHLTDILWRRSTLDLSSDSILLSAQFGQFSISWSLARLKTRQHLDFRPQPLSQCKLRKYL